MKKMNMKLLVVCSVISLSLSFILYLPITWGKGDSTISPTAGLNSLINNYEDKLPQTKKRDNTLTQHRIKLLDSKFNGESLWGADEWMKELSHYNKLDTISLALEFFSRGIFSSEMMAFDNYEYAFQRLEVMHNGFQELFQRSDMWQGIIEVYNYYTSKLSADAHFKDVVFASSGLGSLQYLYYYDNFKDQVKGREAIFFKANLNALKQFQYYLENYSSEKIGTELPFYSAPSSVSNVALMLHKQVDNKKFLSIKADISAIRWEKEQNIEDVRRFLDTVIKALENQGNQ